MFYIQGLRVPIFLVSVTIFIVGLMAFIITDAASDTTLREWGLMALGRLVSWIGFAGLMITYTSWLIFERRMPTLREAICRPVFGAQIVRYANNYREGDRSLMVSLELDRITYDYTRKMQNRATVHIKGGLGLRRTKDALRANEPLNEFCRLWRRRDIPQCGITLYLRWPTPQMLLEASQHKAST